MNYSKQEKNFFLPNVSLIKNSTLSNMFYHPYQKKNIINFSIGLGVGIVISCQGEEDMTWKQWCDTSYNVLGVESINLGLYVYYKGTNFSGEGGITPSTIIQDGETYYFAPERPDY